MSAPTAEQFDAAVASWLDDNRDAVLEAIANGARDAVDNSGTVTDDVIGCGVESAFSVALYRLGRDTLTYLVGSGIEEAFKHRLGGFEPWNDVMAMVREGVRDGFALAPKATTVDLSKLLVKGGAK
jgi:hypothetical protein